MRYEIDCSDLTGGSEPCTTAFCHTREEFEFYEDCQYNLDAPTWIPSGGVSIFLDGSVIYPDVILRGH